MKGRTPIGRFIHSSWTNLNIRCGKYKYLQTKIKCRTYENIIIEFTREEYKDFCILNANQILKLIKPSLDRKDKTKNYSIDNIQFIELSDNIRKDKIKSKNGKCVCFKCKIEKEIIFFAKSKERSNGHSTLCKKCDSLRKNNKIVENNYENI